MHNIEIGMNVVAKLYLHTLGLDETPVGFEVRRIKDIEETEVGTVIIYLDNENKYESSLNEYSYIVSESKTDIEEAIKEATSYRDAALKAINDAIEK